MDTMNTKYSLSDWDSEQYVDQLMRENDDQSMACPTFDFEPDLLLSKVRQHYMKHVVKLLSVNYENNQRLLNKNIYLPSGIWRCAKFMEMKAAQSSMVIQLYRKQILALIKEVKADTEKGKLNRRLLSCLRSSTTEKKTQTQTTLTISSDQNCKCHCNDGKRRRKTTIQSDDLAKLLQGNSEDRAQFKIPVALNMKTNTPEPIFKDVLDMTQCRLGLVSPENYADRLQQPSPTNKMMLSQVTKPTSNMTSANNIKIPSNNTMPSNNMMPSTNNMQLTNNVQLTNFTMPSTTNMTPTNIMMPTSNMMPSNNMMASSNMMTPVHPGNDSDDIMLQLERLFHTEQTDDDLFDATFNEIEPSSANQSQNDIPVFNNEQNNSQGDLTVVEAITANDSVIAAQIRSLDERLATLTGILVNNESNTPEMKQEKKVKVNEKVVKKRKFVSKWECEEYFQKKSLYEDLYMIGDTNRKKLLRVKEKYIVIFGDEDEEDEGILSPMEDNPQIILSCKTRISVSVLKTLTPYFLMGRIRGKNLFKSVVKHLIDLIFKCKQYPDEFEIVDFVKDFIRRHAVITCEADYVDIIDTVRQGTYTFA